MKLPCALLMGLVCWLWISVAFAQTPTATLTGRVLDARTRQPLPFASVYLNNSTRGTTADENGVYRLTNLPLGTHELVGSMLGHATTRQTLRLGEARAYPIDLKLEPAGHDLTAVTVQARRSPVYARQLRSFTRELLGNRPPARQTRITNPNVLRFEEDKGHLRARATEPLVIENGALGYRLHYTLLHFDLYGGKLLFAGTSRFEELEPADARQQATWQANRLKAYHGSLHHLLASLLAGTHEQEGYLIYRTPLAVDGGASALPLVRTAERHYLGPAQAQALFRPGELPFERRLRSGDPLEVYYNRAYAANSPYGDSPDAYSLLLLPSGSLEVTTDGWITQGKGLDVRGYLGNDRLATLLPADWTPAPREVLSPTAITAGRPGRPEAGLDSLLSRRQQDYERTPPVVFVHTDKALYSTGDPLWLSAYVLDPARQLPLAGRSGTALEVELLAPTGRVVEHQWLRLSDGRAAGRFRLADTLRAGTYRLRAYTALDPVAGGPAFECSFPVYNLRQSAPGNPLSPAAPTRPGALAAGLADSPDVQFLPEGGRWLAGAAGRLGIKALQPDGHGLAVKGRIVDQAGQEVARFSTNALGMGQVVLTPQAGQRYTALVETATGALPQRVTLPEVEPEGYALAVDALSDSSRLMVSLRATGRYREQPVYVTLQSREQFAYGQQWLLTKGEARFSLSTATLPPGVCRLTLWDASYQPRAERLVFVAQRTGGVQMRVLTAKPRYESREPVAIGLQFRDAEGYPVMGSWSAAVTDADQLPADTGRPDLQSYLLLTGGLRGRVEHPAHYLLPEHRADLDNLLLTQGWRRLPAPGGVADSTGGWSLSGRVRDEQGRPVVGKTVALTLEQGRQRMMRRVGTDAQGGFRLDGLTIADTVQVRAGVLNPGPGGAVVSFDAPGVPFPTPPVAAPDWRALSGWLSDAGVRQTAWPALYRDSTARQLAEVVVRAAKPRPERPADVQRASLHSETDGVFVPEVGVVYQNIGDLLGRVPGINLLHSRNYSSFGDNTPLYLMDGMAIDFELLREIDPSIVSRVELLKNAGTAGIYGARSANGVIAIYTRKGGRPEPVSASTSVATTVTGFVTPREFYVPRYDSPAAHSHTDRRDVLFWEPLGQNDADGLARLVFPLSDTAKRLRVVVQGITSEGLPMSFSWELPVR